MSAETFPAPEDLLPHAAPMVLVDEVLSWNGETIVVKATLRDRHGFVEDGVAPALVCVEYMAQAIGCAEGLKNRESQAAPVTVGLLLGTRELRLDVDQLRCGQELAISAKHAFSSARLASYHCEVSCEGQRLAAADLNVFAGSAEELST